MPPKRPREDSITSSRASGDADADTHTGVDASDSESVSEYQDVKPNLAKASKTTKSSASKATKVKVEKKASKPKPKAIKTPKTSTSASSDAGGKKMGPWAADELKELYTVMCPKRVRGLVRDISGGEGPGLSFGPTRTRCCAELC